MLEQAIDRIEPLAYAADNIWISTTQYHAARIGSLVRGRVGKIIADPISRNTAPAIVHCCHLLHEHDAQARVIFLPADAFIALKDYNAFRTGIQHAMAWIEQYASVVLCGVKPQYPATGYGYIEYIANNTDNTSVYPVTHFHEKPNYAVAQYYMQLPQMLWNIGIFGGQVSSFIAQFQCYAPELLKSVTDFIVGLCAYDSIPAISIDYALIERMTDVCVVPMAITWCDVGNISVLLALQQKLGAANKVMSLNAADNLVYAQDKLVVLIGVDNLCVVDTHDVLLVTSADAAESVKVVVNQLKQQGSSQYL